MAKKGRLAVEGVYKYLSAEMISEIERICRSRRQGAVGIREIRIRKEGRCSLLYLDEIIPLYTTVCRQEAENMIRRLSDGAIYAHRDSIASGYLSLPFGVRVGLCGYARYESGELVGVSELRSLVFRIPTGECDFSEELEHLFRTRVQRGLLIFSPPGGGKTTALRSLAHSLGEGAMAMRVAVVDERCEFWEEDFESSEVDLLRGYKRREGIEIATRTMSPEVIMIDEIGTDEAEGVAQAVRTGIPLVATAHASSFSEARERVSLEALFRSGAFDLLVGIFQTAEGFRVRAESVYEHV